MSDETTPNPAPDAGSAAAPDAGPTLDARAREDLRERVVDVLRTIYDPEIPVDIYELGLIYEIEIDERGQASVQMTLTSPACPVAGSLPPEVEWKVASVDGVRKAEVELVWDPPWSPDRMSEAAKLQLNLM
jgi:FeS assembly SUF system protein